MSQKMIYNRNYQQKFLNGEIKNASCQTGDDKMFLIYLANNKTAKIYYSTTYKETVLCFTFGSKSFIITKSMWNIFKKHFSVIESLINV